MAKIGPLFERDRIGEKVFASGAAVPVISAKAPSRHAVRSDIDDLPKTRSPKRPNAHAIVIGIQNYRQLLPQAEFADADARLVARYLTGALGFEDANVAVLTNEAATKSDFEKYLDGWLPNRVREGDEVFLYFSGHGAPNPASGDAYLVPYDGDPTYLDQTAYPLKKLYSRLGSLPTKSITVVMDSCFSGAGGRSVLANGARPLVNLKAEGLADGVRVLAASKNEQISHGYQDQGHGLFTYFLLKEIKARAGKAWGWREVFDAAAPEVANVARREYNADQTPQWRGR